jgi:hypothetical protein
MLNYAHEIVGMLKIENMVIIRLVQAGQEDEKRRLLPIQ